ncbi:MAG: hypothetical protein HQK76_14525 [Desulfobacterales bacterium]|nr:hypothetical protein [Desulfobacterales bacterium]
MIEIKLKSFIVYFVILLTFFGMYSVCSKNELSAQSLDKKKCLYVASYHHDYPWQDGIEKGLHKVLNGHCIIKQFNMDTNRYPQDAQQKALEAKALIETWKPDVVIASDDNASKYLIVPFFKNAAIPFIFCGVNESVEEYGFPFSNVTGMMEVAPIKGILTQIKKILPNAEAAVCLAMDGITGIKFCNQVKEISRQEGIVFKNNFMKNMQDFERY